MAFGLGGLAAAFGRSRMVGRSSAAADLQSIFGDALVADWDANHGITVTGSGVSSWASQVGSFALVQATDAARPAFQATGWDGTRPCLVGDGLASNGDHLTATGPFGNEQTIFIVAERGTQNDDAASGIRPVYSTVKSSGAASRMVTVARPTADAGQTQLFAQGTGSGGSAALCPDSWAANQKGVIVARIGASPLFTVKLDDGEASVSAADGSGANTQTNVTAFGRSAVASQRFGGKIGRIAVVNRAATEQEEAAAVAILRGDWGLL